MNKAKLQTAIQSFIEKQKTNSAYYADHAAERNARKEYYQSFTKDRILAMTEETFHEYISKLWSMLIWGNKKYKADKLVADNGLEHIRKQLAELLFGESSIETRWDSFLRDVKGLGPATMSELLIYRSPHEYMIFNKTTVLCFTYLGIDGMPRYDYQYTGKKYTDVCTIAKEISAQLATHNLPDVDLLAVDYFLWDEVLPFAKKKTSIMPDIANTTEKITSKESQSLHDEIRDKLVTIGDLLGFESYSEVKIAAGAKVDAIWEAKIGNMGKAIYVFEVQSKGAIDSLILNLKKAQSNAAVQAVVAVSDEAQLQKILAESKGVIDEASLRMWGFDDVLAVFDSLTSAHESINKLALVPESFQ